MNKQSLKTAQNCIDDVIAAIVRAELSQRYPHASTLETWHSALDTARLELIEFEYSLRPVYVTDVAGVWCNGE